MRVVVCFRTNVFSKVLGFNISSLGTLDVNMTTAQGMAFENTGTSYSYVFITDITIFSASISKCCPVLGAIATFLPIIFDTSLLYCLTGEVKMSDLLQNVTGFAIYVHKYTQISPEIIQALLNVSLPSSNLQVSHSCSLSVSLFRSLTPTHIRAHIFERSQEMNAYCKRYH